MTKNKSRPLVLFAAGLLWMSTLQAQESVNASGGDAAGSGGTVAYSVGQVLYTSNSGTAGTVAEGVQQAYEIFTVGIQEPKVNISLTAFPNPTLNNLTLEVNDYNNENLLYQLYDISGKLIGNGQIASSHTQISMEHWPSATYFLHVVNQENQKIQSFKIVKIQ
jgi:hypothetical protein